MKTDELSQCNARSSDEIHQDQRQCLRQSGLIQSSSYKKAAEGLFGGIKLKEGSEEGILNYSLRGFRVNGHISLVMASNCN